MRTHTTWYAPVGDPEDVRRAVHWALARPGIFVNTASDLGLLALQLDAAESYEAAPRDEELRATWGRLGVEPLFTPGMDGVR